METKIYNFWLLRARQENILKVVEFAHRNKIPVENLTKEEIITGLKYYLRPAQNA